MTGVSVGAKYRTQKPVSFFTYLTVQVPRRDTNLQGELRRCPASLPADWGEKPNAFQGDREFGCIPNLNSPDRL